MPNIQTTIRKTEHRLRIARQQASELLTVEQDQWQRGHVRKAAETRRSRVRIASSVQDEADLLADALDPANATMLKCFAANLRKHETIESDHPIAAACNRLMAEHERLQSAADQNDFIEIERAASRIEAMAATHTRDLTTQQKEILVITAKIAETSALFKTHRATSEALQESPKSDPKSDPAVAKALTEYRRITKKRREFAA